MRSPGVPYTVQMLVLWGKLTRQVINTRAAMNSTRRRRPAMYRSVGRSDTGIFSAREISRRDRSPAPIGIHDMASSIFLFRDLSTPLFKIVPFFAGEI